MRKTIFTFFVLAIFCAANAFASDAEVADQESNAQLIGTVMKRGAMNFLTFPGEIVRTGEAQKKAHPKAWPATYIPRVFGNLTIRLTSSINDMFIMPWYVWATKDTRPITHFFDLPDYPFDPQED